MTTRPHLLHTCLRALLRTLAIATTAMAFTPSAQAQDDVVYRMEIGGALGIGSTVTDVNPRLYGENSAAAGALLRFVINPRMAVKTQMLYSRVSGNTQGLKGFLPANGTQASAERLNFTAKGNFYDLSGIYELHFLPYGYERGYQGYSRLVPFIQMGLGLVYAQESKALALQVPLGLGLKYKAGRRLNIALEWQMHFSTGDELDKLNAPLTIPSSGFKNKDHYGMTMLTLTYDISPLCPTCNKD